MPASPYIALEWHYAPEQGDDAVPAAVLGLVCLCLFAILNPFLALFFVALLSLYWRVPNSVFIVIASLSFAVFFSSREFGVEWFPGVSGDDVPIYMGLYESNYGLSVGDLVERFVAAPNGNEILWHLPWWALINWFGASTETFIFIHYLVNFLTLFLALRLVSSRYCIVFAAIYFFLTPLTVDGIAHVWRQQLAFTMFLAGVGLQYSRGTRFGGWLMHLAFFIHLSVIFFLLAYWTFVLIRRFRGFDRKLRFIVFIVVLMACVPLLSSIAVRFLDSLGMARIMLFFEGYGTNVLRVYLLLGVYAVPMLAAFFWLRTDDMNRLFLVLCLAVFSIVLALPSANGVYDRLLMFALPLMGLYFYRCLLMNFPRGRYASVLCLVFAVGAYRLYLPTREESGVLYFAGNGHGTDVTMGLLRLLVGQ